MTLHTIDEFLRSWEATSQATSKLFSALTDESLGREVVPGHRTLGRIAWHIVQTISEMMGRTGLEPGGPGEAEPVPRRASEILAGYAAASGSLLEQVRDGWQDRTLFEEDEMYGTRWKRGFTLRVLIQHEIHHRGQMTVLMRQAGLTVPGLMGPAREEWEQFGMPVPEI